jgi:PAS domain S-box-containing protein
LAHDRGRQHVRGRLEEVNILAPKLASSPGEQRYTLVRKFPLLDESGLPFLVGGIGVDITNQKQTELALDQNRRRLQALFDNSMEAILIADDDARFVDANPAACELFGYSREQLVQLTIWDLTPEETRERGRRAWREFLATGRWSGEYTVQRQDGTHFEVEFRAVANFVPGLHLSVNRDITERKKAAERLERSERQYRLLFDNNPQPLWVFDFETFGFAEVNDAAVQHYGYSRPEWLAMTSWDLWPRDEDPAWQQFRASLEAELLESQVEHRLGKIWKHRKKDGSVIDVELTHSRIVFEGRAAVLARANDVTARLKADVALRELNRRLEAALAELESSQQQLILQERLRALGQMACGIAHDINNSLSPVLGYCEMLLSDPQMSVESRGRLELIHTGALDAAAVVERLQHVHREPGSKELESMLDLAELARQVCELTRPRWRDEAQRTGRVIEMQLDLEEVPRVLGNATELRELLANLVMNAVDAMPSGGHIRLRLRLDPPFAVLDVSDTGIGMTEQVRTRCFEPFFTTKGPTGTGLGLTVCHNIVERHHGHIEIESAPAQGTTFHIRLPLANSPPAPPQARPVQALSSWRLLYIDDDPRVREAVASMLVALGQQVDVADGGAAGLAMFRANLHDLVITDLGMPELDGCDVIRRVKAIRPHVPVIMLTGWTSPLVKDAIGKGEPPDFIVRKPITMVRLRELIERIQHSSLHQS